MNVKNIFLSGTMRSGTTLMASMLNAHPDITLISDLLQWFWTKCYNKYGNIDTEYELDMIFYDLRSSIYNGLNDEIKKQFENGTVKERIIKRGVSYKSIYEVLIETYNKKEVTTKIQGSKATHKSSIYEDFLTTFDSPLIIHMVRDCKDVYISHKKRSVNEPENKNIKEKLVQFLKAGQKKFVKTLIGEKNYKKIDFQPGFLYQYPLKMIDDWVITNQRAYQLREKFPNNLLIIKYEDLIQKNEEVLRNLFIKIGLPYKSEYFEYQNLKDRDGNPFKANTSFNDKNLNGLSNSRIGYGCNYLDDSELDYYTIVASKYAKIIGY